MKEVCVEFLGDIHDFQRIADSFISIFDTVSQVATKGMHDTRNVFIYEKK